MRMRRLIVYTSISLPFTKPTISIIPACAFRSIRMPFSRPSRLAARVWSIRQDRSPVTPMSQRPKTVVAITSGLPPHIVIEFKKDSRILDPIPGSQLRRLNGDASGFQLWRGVCPPETRARSYYSGSVKAQAWRSTSSSLHASTIRPFARKASPPASRCGSSGMLMQSSGLLAITICLVSRCTNCCS